MCANYRTKQQLLTNLEALREQKKAYDASNNKQIHSQKLHDDDYLLTAQKVTQLQYRDLFKTCLAEKEADTEVANHYIENNYKKDYNSQYTDQYSDPLDTLYADQELDLKNKTLDYLESGKTNPSANFSSNIYKGLLTQSAMLAKQEWKPGDLKTVAEDEKNIAKARKLASIVDIFEPSNKKFKSKGCVCDDYSSDFTKKYGNIAKDLLTMEYKPNKTPQETTTTTTSPPTVIQTTPTTLDATTQLLNT